MSNVLAAPPAGELVLGRYRPVRPLGSGGSGSVWLARDEGSGLEVALKIVPRGGKPASRAQREAAAAARLRHERCVRAYAFARDERHVYIAYEYVEGRTLRERLYEGDLGDEELVEVAAQVLDGLTHAHTKGIVHRDVKPSNVLVEDGERVAARVSDFGLAAFDDAEPLTATGDVPGTLAYIAPERLRGGEGSPAADVWAVGVFLWEALAGRHPFLTGSPVEMAKKIQAGAPPLGSARPDLPEALCKLVDRALALDPARRPSAERLAKGLRKALAPRDAVASNTVLQAPARAALPLPVVGEGVRTGGAAVLAALVAGWTASALPFYPARWPLLLAALAGGLTALRPRAGLAFTLAVPVFPLGNVSLGLALLYAAFAPAWLLFSWRTPRQGLLAVLGPLLAPLAALGLLPLALAGIRGTVRRAVQAALAVLLAAVVAGVRHVRLPFGSEPPPVLAITGAEAPTEVARDLLAAAASRPSLAFAAVILGAAAAALPHAARRGPWWIAGFGTALLAALLLAIPEAPAAPAVAAVWCTCGALALGRALLGRR